MHTHLNNILEVPYTIFPIGKKIYCCESVHSFPMCRDKWIFLSWFTVPHRLYKSIHTIYLAVHSGLDRLQREVPQSELTSIMHAYLNSIPSQVHCSHCKCSVQPFVLGIYLHTSHATLQYSRINFHIRII